MECSHDCQREATTESKKKEFQTKFRDHLGLFVEIPKPNFENTNDGNRSQRFLVEFELSAEISGINRNLIHPLKVILDAMCSGIKIKPEKFNAYYV